MEYNFIVVCLEGELYKYAYNQLNELSNAFFDIDFPHNKVLAFLQKVHCSTKLNSVINLPFKGIWIKKRIKIYKKQIQKFKKPEAKLCFVLFADCLHLERMNFLTYLKEAFPNCKIVYYFQDLVKKDINKQKLLEKPNPYIDLIYSFDLGDAQKYNLEYYDIPYSNLCSLFPKVEIKYDVIFVGLAKDRLDTIIQVYDILEKQSIVCAFYIVDADSENKIYRSGIHYVEPLKYVEYINIVNSSRCILEIMQKGGTGNTIRVCEARAFEKKLLSNNKYLINNKLYDDKNMKVFDSLDDLLEIKSFIYNSDRQYADNEKMYPKAFLEEIESRLIVDENNI